MHNGGALTAAGPPPFGPHDPRSNSGETWADVPPLRSAESLQLLSAYPPLAGLPHPGLHDGAQPPHQSTGMSSDVVVGIPAVPIGMAMPHPMPPHPHPGSSPLLTHFRPMSSSLGSSSRSGGGGSGGAGTGSPELVGMPQHMAVAPGLASGWEEGPGTAHGETPAPPPAPPQRVDTFLAGVDSSPVSATAGGSASGSVSSKLGPLTPSTTLVTRHPEDERLLDLLSRDLLRAAGVRGNAEGNGVGAANGSTEETT
jgi:hypothetical protein